VSVRLDMTLKLGEVSNVVEVSGQSPLLQAINASVGQVISEFLSVQAFPYPREKESGIPLRFLQLD